MQYFKSSEPGHYYGFDGDDSCIHVNVDDCLINILTGEEFKKVCSLYAMYQINESEFLPYYGVTIDSFNQLLFNVTAN